MLEQSSHVIVLLFLSNYGKLVTVLFIEGKSIMPFIGHKGGKTPKYNEEFLNDFSACVLDSIHQRLSTSDEANRIEDALQDCLVRGMDLKDLFDEVVEATVSANGFTFVCDTAITPRASISFELGSSMLYFDIDDVEYALRLEDFEAQPFIDMYYGLMCS